MGTNLVCSNCTAKVDQKWRFCRFCGSRLQQDIKQVEEEISTQVEQEIKEEKVVDLTPEKEKVEFDKDLYYKVLSTRAERSLIIKEKKEISKEIKSLLEQVQAGLVDRSYATPKIKELKARVNEISKEEEKYSKFPEELPIEILNDQIIDARARGKKLDKLKNDENVSKEAINEAKSRNKQALAALMDEQSTVFGYLRNWKSEIEDRLDVKRKESQQLYIKMKTEEITEDTFKDRKGKIVKAMQNDEEVVHMLNQILDE